MNKKELIQLKRGLKEAYDMVNGLVKSVEFNQWYDKEYSTGNPEKEYDVFVQLPSEEFNLVDYLAIETKKEESKFFIKLTTKKL